MTYVNSITSKGQITLPKEFRDRLGLDKIGKAQISINNKNEIVITPPISLAEIRRILAHPSGNEPLTEHEKIALSQISEK